MKIDLIGMGAGGDTLTAEARQALENTRLILGASRLLSALPEGITAPRQEAVYPEEILRFLKDFSGSHASILFSGDSGFYSGTRKLLPLLSGHEVAVLPGISSLQLLAARLKRPWQDWLLLSAHGTECDLPTALMEGKPCFLLTGPKSGPGILCRQLVEAGLPELTVTVGENLGTPDERIRTSSARDFAGQDFAPLSVMLTESAPRFIRRTPGLPDELFLRDEGIPMTKQDIRAAILARLAVAPEDTCWDIGAGTGSVSIELALQCRAVQAVEKNPAALELLKQNRDKFCAWNLQIIPGSAPAALDGLPKPDAVFIGGSGGHLPAILRAVRQANASARLCIAAVTLETLQTACETLQELGYATEVSQFSVNRSRPLGPLTMLKPQNPVFLITGAER